MGPPLMTVVECARELHWDPRTLRAALKRGDLPGLTLTVGRRIFIRRAVLEKMLLGGFALPSVSAAVAVTTSTLPDDGRVS
jgi:hypothetical protein